MRRAQAIDEIKAAGAQPVEVRDFLRFRRSGSTGKSLSFFPNHYETMRRGEVEAHVRAATTEAPMRRRPRDD